MYGDENPVVGTVFENDCSLWTTSATLCLKRGGETATACNKNFVCFLMSAGCCNKLKLTIK